MRLRRLFQWRSHGTGVWWTRQWVYVALALLTCLAVPWIFMLFGAYVDWVTEVIFHTGRR